ncbi:MBOAT, membrane-bound O-acyltransferase family-domain-containing protein [Polychytrium aggregatum]|uniref:MBOAT, membrane-bound O-acyltransferase family-domain-containing protein n=1 Tax=Polychytrium aggregatum TaxID=110093 RepID=UPI0022FDF771|nr:MBOAT, membrane-bound O-acyltransferase family-domain-containing protein [Polychytrium aggregatum]KAI9207900.1 MBOAT, membrane-bound O-acyltransferase family-domain-containing protein [Polychytrium aggregatum]
MISHFIALKSAVDEQVAGLAALTGLSDENLRPGLVLFGVIPLSLVFLCIPRSLTTARHLFSFVLSTLVFSLLFSFEGFLHLFTSALLTYVIVALGKSHKYTPVAVILLTMGHLSFCFLKAQIFDKSSARFDHTAPMMVLVQKLSSFAWAAYDGTLPVEKLTNDQKVRAIHKFPGLVGFFGYTFFYGSFLVGPAFEFRDYQRFIDNETSYPSLPSRSWASVKRIGIAVIFLVGQTLYGEYFTFNLCLTDEYLLWPAYKRIGYVFVAGFVARFKFYTAWKLAEATCILIGLGYSNGGWRAVENVNFFGLEFAQSPKVFVDNWNQQTTLWLRNSVYTRIAPPGSKSTGLATFFTYLTSAFWHGFHPGYYVTFVFGGIVTMMGRSLRRTVRPLFADPNSKLARWKFVYDVLGCIGTQFIFNSVVSSFQLLRLDWTVQFYRNNYYLVPAMILGWFVLFDVLKFTRLIKRFGRWLGVRYENEVVVQRERKSATAAAKKASGETRKTQ